MVDLLGDILDQTAEDMLAMGETELAGEIAKQWGDIRMQAQLFERVSINVYASEQGLVMEQAMQLR